jgi:hypothetical protein
MVIKDEIEFINLPDWKKVHLKISYSKFANYRLMTDEQEQNRKQKIFAIAAHYGQLDIDELQQNPSLTLDNSWPKNIEKYITPKLLDLFNVDWFCKFGYCYMCDYFSGHNKAHYKYLFAKKPKNKITTFSGKCRHVYNRRNHKASWILNHHEFVDPKFCCHLWEPMELYFQIIQIEISNRLYQLNANLDFDYDVEDYAFDLHNVNIWNYFFNKYDRYEL